MRGISQAMAKLPHLMSVSLRSIARNKPVLFNWTVSAILTVVAFATDLRAYGAVLLLSWALSASGPSYSFLIRSQAGRE